jgi:hypothetical protein
MGWILELDRGVFLERELFVLVRSKSSRMALEEKVASNVEKLRTRVGLGSSRAKGQTKQKARLQNYDKLLNEDQKQLDEN